jgi:hypothetical protein
MVQDHVDGNTTADRVHRARKLYVGDDNNGAEHGGKENASHRSFTSLGEMTDDCQSTYLLLSFFVIGARGTRHALNKLIETEIKTCAYVHPDLVGESRGPTNDKGD